MAQSWERLQSLLEALKSPTSRGVMSGLGEFAGTEAKRAFNAPGSEYALGGPMAFGTVLPKVERAVLQELLTGGRNLLHGIEGTPVRAIQTGGEFTPAGFGGGAQANAVWGNLNELPIVLKRGRFSPETDIPISVRVQSAKDYLKSILKGESPGVPPEVDEMTLRAVFNEYIPKKLGIQKFFPKPYGVMQSPHGPTLVEEQIKDYIPFFPHEATAAGSKTPPKVLAQLHELSRALGEHGLNIADLSGSNFVLDKAGNLKILDAGIWSPERNLKFGEGVMARLARTKQHMTPEEATNALNTVLRESRGSIKGQAEQLFIGPQSREFRRTSRIAAERQKGYEESLKKMIRARLGK